MKLGIENDNLVITAVTEADEYDLRMLVQEVEDADIPCHLMHGACPTVLLLDLRKSSPGGA